LKSDSEPEEQWVARVYNSYLSLDDINSKYPGGMTLEDSSFWSRNFVNMWVQEQLLLHHAIVNLPDNEKDFSRQLEEYKNSLLQLSYERRLVEQNLDTVVPDQEIEDYYNGHLDDFIANRIVVRAFYVVIHKDSSQQLREFRRNLYPLQFHNIEEFLYANEIQMFNIDTTCWIYFDELLTNIPIPNITNPNYYLKYNRYVNFTDDQFWYYLNFLEFRLLGDRNPLQLEQERIEKIILSRRKEALLKNLRREIFEDALENGSFEIL
jgi:hypothetical protein